jgi:hypothetical protein
MKLHEKLLLEVLLRGTIVTNTFKESQWKTCPKEIKRILH